MIQITNECQNKYLWPIYLPHSDMNIFNYLNICHTLHCIQEFRDMHFKLHPLSTIDPVLHQYAKFCWRSWIFLLHKMVISCIFHLLLRIFSENKN